MSAGCLGLSSSEYEGVANVSWNGLACVSWDSPAAVSALRYRVSDAVRRKTLSGHNHCRRVSNNHEPWCFVDAGAAGIKAERCDIPACSEKGNDQDQGTSPPGGSPGLYRPDGRPRPPLSGDFPLPSPPVPSAGRWPYPGANREQDNPDAEPRGTSGSDRPWPTLPTSRPFVRAGATTPMTPTSTWPNPFAGRSGRSPRPSTSVGRGSFTTTPIPPRSGSAPAGTTPGPTPSATEDDAMPGWPAVYAPDFSHRAAEQLPPPPPTDLLPPMEGEDQLQPRWTTAEPNPSTSTDPTIPRDREELEDVDYPFVPDPLTMPRPSSRPSPRPANDLGYDRRPDPARGYGLPAPRGLGPRPPVVTARPPAELYNSLLPGQNYAPYPGELSDTKPPSYSNLFGLLPALPALAEGRYPYSSQDLPRGVYPNPDLYPEGGYPYPTGGNPRQPDPREGYDFSDDGYPRPQGGSPGSRRVAPQAVAKARRDRGSGEDSNESEDSSAREDRRFDGLEQAEDRYPSWPPRNNGHSGPGGAVGAEGALQSRTGYHSHPRQSRTAPSTTPAPATTTTTAAAASAASSTPPPFSRPAVPPEPEHVMRIAKPGEKMLLQITTEKIFFM